MANPPLTRQAIGKLQRKGTCLGGWRLLGTNKREVTYWFSDLLVPV